MRSKNFDDLPLILTPKDLAKIYPGGRNKVYELFHRTDFPAVRHGRRFFVFKDALKNWLEGKRDVHK